MKRNSDGRDKAMYCVIIGDIIGSREMNFETRELATEAIKATLNRINEEYRNSILADFGIVRGDALEGILLTSFFAVDLIQDMIWSLYRQGIRLRISAVVDELSVVSDDRNEADGPAFHLALDKLNQLKTRKSDHWLQVSFVTGTTAQPLVDGLFLLMSALTEGWTERQCEIACAMDTLPGGQIQVSEALGISPPAVNKQLKAMRYWAYFHARDTLILYLQNEEAAKKQKEVAAV